MNLDVKQTTRIFGTTIYIGSMPMQTRYGKFICHTYQNLIHKGYILALSYGSLEAPELYTRVHSSCVTSETLRSMDCDCVHQLEGAMEVIAKKGHGILFYLIQEGRGCGYVGKSRACMFVQYHDDQITTFDAYQTLGMKADYRDYRNIWEITHMLDIASSKFVLLTNNPDKIKGLQEVGLHISRVESIEVAPSPFNQSYLISKEQTGHLLYKTKTKISKYKTPFEKIKPFEPYALDSYSRYIHCASYYLPIKPVDHQILCSKEDRDYLEKENIEHKIALKIDDELSLVKVFEKDLDRVPMNPYWFKVNMYYDLASHCDYIVLSYGDLKNKIPLVRIHSESIFNRFPLSSKIYRKKYKYSLLDIVKNGSGLVVLLYHDGRGAGLGSYILNQTQNNFKTGIPLDSRDYKSVAMLLDHHLPEKKLKMLYSNTSRVFLKEALEKQGLEVCSWLQFQSKNEEKGHEIISRRIQDAPHYLFQLKTEALKLDSSADYIVTGIGGSEAHAQYLIYLLQRYHPDIKIKFLPLTAFQNYTKNNSKLLLISQGLSPNTWGTLKAWQFQDIILFTAVTLENSNKEKVEILKRLQRNHCPIYHFPLEDEYTTLIRTVGPLIGYYLFYKLFHPEKSLSLPDEKSLFATLKNSASKAPPHDFYDSLKKNSQIILLSQYPHSLYFKNLMSKLEEGAFLKSVRLVDYLELSHGVFQNVEYQFQKGHTHHFILFKNSHTDEELLSRTKLMLGNKYPCWEIESQLPEDLCILEYEMVLNHFILEWMESMHINQVEWAGKDRQNYIYDWHIDTDTKKKVWNQGSNLQDNGLSP